ncbi:unnamed protein product [Protopolystoma xenopodis]|uniref:Uncharacterized protein n=1 Tax=Protopolystoma xenopodis TaxID=117903 RepID=A0A3S5B4F7_9PLAT|nr:unnamed protein product [Protopolystoma xenopodis]
MGQSPVPVAKASSDERCGRRIEFRLGLGITIESVFSSASALTSDSDVEWALSLTVDPGSRFEFDRRIDVWFGFGFWIRLWIQLELGLRLDILPNSDFGYVLGCGFVFELQSVLGLENGLRS